MHGGIAPSQTSTVSIQHDFFFLLYKNVVCSVIIGLGRIEMWKTLICHINASIFLFFVVISTNIFQRSCWKLNAGFHDHSEETLTTSQTGSWRKNFRFTVSVF